MHRMYIFLFAIPLISIAGIGIYQVVDEMFKKIFVLERRVRQLEDQEAAGMPRRRYSDEVPAGVLRHPETVTPNKTSEVSLPQTHGA